ncbi:TonB-dependent receptor [Pedobacter deserti]|uniref:TonB-dependent receptor n=1 Tax=Pedobacter deserti TaxID=2817382 RepID=UPI00210CBF13|nr:TonB-dependent receptor [Pedobacter sp. SYSU D00382]
MNLKRSLVAVLLLSMAGFLAFTPMQTDPLEKMIAALEKWAESNPQEKVYLHTDRPYYLVGDTIWFKAYVTLGAKNQLSGHSGAVYVDLFNESDSLAKALKLPVISGMAKGEFILADSNMRDGNYRIRAYTQWMRNAGPEYYYNKVFKVGNSVANPVFTKVTYEYPAKGAVTAVVTYTNDKGEPYANKAVSYDFIDNSAIASSGKKETDAQGQIRVELKGGKSKTFQNAHLATKLQLEEKSIIVKKFMIKSVATEADIQFFPEGGQLVNGVRSRVAFKAIGTSGNGVDVKGVITDQANQEVAQFESQHLGMGYFQLQPEAGKTYTAQVTYADGSKSAVKLPAALAAGHVLSVYNTGNDTALVRIRTSEATLAASKGSLGLVVQGGGVVYFGSPIAVDKPMVSIPVPLKDIPSGILQFTLFSGAGIATNERIIFVQNTDKLNLSLSSNKTEYKAREKVDIAVSAKDAAGQPATGSFSVAVVNETTVPSGERTEHSIFSHLLLSSDIKGYVEQPNYYFVEPNEETAAKLDVLMMTQGYRRFVWRDLAVKPLQFPYPVEKLTSAVSGKLLDLRNRPVANGKITLINNRIGLVIDTVTDAQGRFKFDNLLIGEGIDFTVQGRTEKGGKNVEVLVDRMSTQAKTPNFNIGDLDSDPRNLMAAILANSRAQEDDLLKRGMMGRTQQLREVEIRARRRFATRVDMLSVPEGHADQTLTVEDPAQFKDVKEFLMMRLTNVAFRNVDMGQCGMVDVPFSRNEPMTIVLNGRKLDHCEAQFVYEGNPTDIIRIDVVRTNMALMSLLGGQSIVISTKPGAFRTRYDPSVTNYLPQGYNNSKEFYSPKYKHDGTDPQVADLRTTIYWNPSVITNNGAASFDFFNADSKGKYKVVIEGISAQGQLGRAVYRYTVN